jgi:hypothetical protein
MGKLFIFNMDTTQQNLKMASETITQYFKNVDDLCLANTTSLERLARLEIGAKMYDDYCMRFERNHGGKYEDAACDFAIGMGVDELNRLCDRVHHITPKLRIHIFKLCELFTEEHLFFYYFGPFMSKRTFSKFLHIPVRYISQFTNECNYFYHLTTQCTMIDRGAILRASNTHLFLFFELVSFAKHTLESYPDDIDFTKAWLLRTGIEPNPGPNASGTRNNRYSAPEPSRGEKKRLKREIRLIKKAYQNARKEKRVFQHEMNEAQLGAESVSINIPQECAKCGRCKCDCMVKRSEMLTKCDFYASLMGLASTVLGVIERIVAMRAASLNHAQIGFGTFFSAPTIVTNMDNIATNVNEVLNNLPTSQGVGEAMKLAVSQIMEAQCGFLPVSVKAVFQCFLTLVGLFVLYHLGCISIQVLTMPLELLFMGVESITGVLRSFRDFAFYTGIRKPAHPGQQAQLGFDDVTKTAEEWGPKALGLLGALISSYCLTKIPDKNNSPAQWMMRIGLFPRTCSGFMDVVSWVEGAFKKILQYVKVNFFGHDPQEFEECIPKIKEWMMSVETFNHKPAFDVAAQTKDGKFMLAHLYDRGAFLMDKYAKALTPELKMFVVQRMREAAKIQNEVETQFPEIKSVRTVPTALWMVGDSQIGKSRLQYLISTRLALEAGYTDVKSQMYQRCVENVFWDGYNGQLVCIYDDFLQMKDSIGAPNLELFEFIRGVGPFPYPLHMANIAAKASTFFTSRIILASTNNAHANIESITFPEAVWNRLQDSSYRIHVREEYLMPAYYVYPLPDTDAYAALERAGWRVPIVPGERTKLNLLKVNKDAPKSSDGTPWEVNPYIYDFQRFCPHTQRDRGYIEQPIGWDTFIARIIASMDGRKADGNNLDKFLDQYAKDFAKGVNIAQVGSEHPTVELMKDVHNAQAGSFRSRTTMEEFDTFIESLPDHETYGFMSGPTMKVTWMMEKEEICKTNTLTKTFLDTYTNEILPDATWNILIVRFYNHKCKPKSCVNKYLDIVINARNKFIQSLPEYARNFLNFITETTCNLVNGVKQFFKDKPLFSLLGCFGASMFFKKMSAGVPSDVDSDIPETFPESDTRNMQPKMRQRARKANASRARIVVEMGQSMGQLDVIARVRTNQWNLSMVTEDDQCISLGTITNIKGQVFMMPAHFYVFLKERNPKEVIMVPSDNRNMRIVKSFDGWFEKDSVVLFTPEKPDDDAEPMDLCMFTLSKMPRGRSILHHFATNDDLEKLSGAKFDGTLSGVDMENDMPVSVSASGKCLVEDIKIVINMPNGFESFDASHVIKHDIRTKVGDCGKVMTVNSDKLAGRIVGIHISGSVLPSSNYCQVVSRESIEAGLKCLPNYAQIDCGLRNLRPATNPFETALISRGQADFVIPQVSKSSIVKSALYGTFGPVLTRPAKLRPWKQEIDGVVVLRDPLREGAAKQGRQCGYLTQRVIDEIELSMRSLILPRIERAPQIRLLTYEESVRGIEGDMLFQPINRLTSPGFPYVLDPRKRGKKGKTFWMGSDVWDFTSPAALELKQDVENLERDLLEDRPHEIIWVDTLKDERRSHPKVDAGKTRMISNGPMHYNVLFRKYYMAALAHLRHHRVTNGIAVGINVWGPEWHSLATYLRGASDEMIDGDMTDFSDRLMDDLTWVNFNLINEIYKVYDADYTDDDRKVRRRLWEYACCAIRYNQGTIYQTTNGTPAGFVPTAENNSLYGLCAFRASYLYLARKYKPDMEDLKHFEENVRVITYGDDNVLAINPKLKEFYNMRNLVEAFDSFGMIYTTADKGTDYDKRKTIKDVSFLKRSFALVKINGQTLPRYVCPAPLETRLDMLNWTSDKHIDNLLEQSDTVTDVFKELAMHPQDVFEKWTGEISKKCYELGINNFRLLPYSRYLEPFCSGGQFVPRKCDLTILRQKTEFNKESCTAASGRGVCINTYTLGSPEAAPQYPREIRSSVMIESSH